MQDDVRLARYAAELGRTVGAAGVGEAHEAFDVVAGPPRGCVRHEDSRQKSHPYRGCKQRKLEKVFRTQRDSGAATCGA